MALFCGLAHRYGLYLASESPVGLGTNIGTSNLAGDAPGTPGYRGGNHLIEFRHH
jgi:hypothetical protein